MTLPDLVLYDEEFRKIKESLQRLASDASLWSDSLILRNSSSYRTRSGSVMGKGFS